jgi:aerobic-type carbon monoxide dehydrogenase small subunit (CoxS/CutS family)
VGRIFFPQTVQSKLKYATDEEIKTAMNGNLCRCGTYDRIQKGIKNAAMALQSGTLPVKNDK